MALFVISLWFVLGICVGILLYVLIPVTVGGDRVPHRLRTAVAQFYFAMSMSAYRRVICGITPHNDLSLYPSNWNDDRQAEEVELDGNDNDWQDPKNLTTRIKDVPFAFALTDLNKIIHPLDAVVGRALEEHDQRLAPWQEFRGGEDADAESIRARSAHVAIPKRLQAVDFQDARRVFTESHEPNDTHRTEEDVRKSQIGFKSHSIKSMMILIIAAMAGSFLAWFIVSNTGEGGQSTVTIGLWLGGMIL